MTEEISRCPCCGSVMGTTLAQAPALLAVCDVLVTHALEHIGKWIVRNERGRFPQLQGRRMGRQWQLAHTLWQPDATMTEKALAGAWDVVPAMLSTHGCCNITADQVTMMLDQYVRDLLVTGTPHSITELRYRFEKYLGIPLLEPTPYQPPMSAQAHE